MFIWKGAEVALANRSLEGAVRKGRTLRIPKLEPYEMTQASLSGAPSRLAHEFCTIVGAHDLPSETLCQENRTGTCAGGDIQHPLSETKIEQVPRSLGQLKTACVKRFSQQQTCKIGLVERSPEGLDLSGRGSLPSIPLANQLR